MLSRRALLVATGLFAATVALAAAIDIPARYVGTFPTDGIRTNISGTFTGKTLTVSFMVVVKNRPLRRTFAGNCSVTSPNQTTCKGRTQGSGSDNLNRSATVVVTWRGGKPIAFSK